MDQKLALCSLPNREHEPSPFGGYFSDEWSLHRPNSTKYCRMYRSCNPISNHVLEKGGVYLPAVV
jgi:hypothetical protein